MIVAKVGPVLVASTEGRAVADAIARENPGATVIDRGGYVRVRADAPCVIRLVALMSASGGAFELPRDLERLMPSFAGRLVMDDAEVRWE